MVELKQAYICDKCGSRDINVRMIHDIETDIPVPAPPISQAKCSASKHNYKSYCLKAMQTMNVGESILIKDRSEATVRGWFMCLARDIVRAQRIKDNKSPRNPFSTRWKYKELLENHYRIEKNAHFEHRIWKIKEV